MPRRILLKENGLESNSAPTGYRFIGLKDSNLASVGTSSKIEQFNTPQVFVMFKSFYDVEDIGGFNIGPSGTQKIDYDLSGGNYSNISIEGGIKFNSLTLPEIWGKNLYNMMLEVETLDDNPVEITLADYPNLSSIKGTGLCFNGTKPYNFEIKDEVIDLPNLKSIGFWGSKRCTTVKTQKSLTIVTHPNSVYLLGSNTLESAELDFSGFTYSSFNSYNSEPTYDFRIELFSPNVSFLTFSNISVYDDAAYSNLTFIFNDMGLVKSSVDKILEVLDNAFPTDMFNSPEISIQRETTITDGELVIGESYLIAELNGSDDFTNVGFVETGVVFVATDTTPNDWTSSTTVYTFYGIAKEFTIEFTNVSLPDGKYYNGGVYLEVNSGLITHAEITDSYTHVYPGLQNTIDGSDFKIIDEWGRQVFSGGSGVHDVLITVTSVTRTSAPTNGQDNTNKLSLEEKGWIVSVNSY